MSTTIWIVAFFFQTVLYYILMLYKEQKYNAEKSELLNRIMARDLGEYQAVIEQKPLKKQDSNPLKTNIERAWSQQDE